MRNTVKRTRIKKKWRIIRIHKGWDKWKLNIAFNKIDQLEIKLELIDNKLNKHEEQWKRLDSFSYSRLVTNQIIIRFKFILRLK